MAEAINRSVDNDGNDVDVLVVVIVRVVFLSEGVIVLALIIAEDAVDCVSIVGIIPEPVCEVDALLGLFLVIAIGFRKRLCP